MNSAGARPLLQASTRCCHPLASASLMLMRRTAPAVVATVASSTFVEWPQEAYVRVARLKVAFVPDSEDVNMPYSVLVEAEMIQSESENALSPSRNPELVLSRTQSLVPTRRNAPPRIPLLVQFGDPVRTPLRPAPELSKAFVPAPSSRVQ